MTCYCCKKKDIGFEPLSPYVKNLIAHMIGVENIVQNVLINDRTDDS